MVGFRLNPRNIFAVSCTLASVMTAGPAVAQSTSGLVNGTVSDPTGAVVPGATVTLANPVSGYTRTVKADGAGQFHFYNLPFNPYRVTVTSPAFAPADKDIDVESALPISVPIALKVLGSASSVTVEAAPDLNENDPHFHTDIDRSTIDTLPVETPSSELSSIITELSPGVAADSNGLLHGLGDHNEVSFSIDGQPVNRPAEQGLLQPGARRGHSIG